jgi:redoxin
MYRRLFSIAVIVLFLLGVFCGGFLFFSNRIQQQSHAGAAEEAKPGSLIDKPFPTAPLVDVYGSRVDEQKLRTGKVIVVFLTPECDACLTESKFLQTLLGRRKDVTFFGLVPFGKHPEDPNLAKKTFPFEVFYDENQAFVGAMGINRVPVKVFLENGIIKKGWIGAALTDAAKQSFVEWLDGLP